MRTPLRCLCPALRPCARPTARAAYLRYYSAAQAQNVPRIRVWSEVEAGKWRNMEQYPRMKKQSAALDYHTFKERYKDIGPGESQPDDEVVVRGMSASILLAYLAHAVKEEYGLFELQAQSWGS